MITVTMTEEEWNQVVQLLINSNPLIIKIAQQLQAAQRKTNGQGEAPNERKE